MKKCKNEFCLHNYANNYGSISGDNLTGCNFYEIDPYDKKSNPEGFNIEDCPAFKRYKKFGWSK